MKKHSQRGVALVTTLIMLSLITFTAVVFLAVTTREGDSVKIANDETGSRLAADMAYNRALAEIAAKMITTSNLYSYEAMSSTNIDGATNAVYDVNTIASLWQDPRPPVFVQTNATNSSLEFRFYADLNRNHVFESNGVPVMEGNTTYIYPGDPEWIGVLERPSVFGRSTNYHSPTNRFVYRYAYFVLPAGKSLDINYIHNYGRYLSGAFPANTDSHTGPGDAFFRDQGVGPWEINTAAFLQQLNTNIWNTNQYGYSLNRFSANSGTAFSDALDLLSFRCNTNIINLTSYTNVFGATNGPVATGDRIDMYAYGVIPTNYQLPTADFDVPTKPWPGGPNTNVNARHFYDAFDLINQGNSFTNFTNHLLSTLSQNITAAAPDTNNLYYRYQVYRMLSQMGAESTTLTRPKLHLNYNNLNSSQTNLIPWTPIEFFTNAAERMLNLQLGVSLTNLQVFPTNHYTPEVHRLLQLAANIYDASTNGVGDTNMPSVFLPVFTNNSLNQVYLHHYESITNTNFLGGTFRTFPEVTNAGVGLYTNIYGMPAVIGVKKGLPNFNRFLMQTAARVTRKLEYVRVSTNAPVSQTNQMFTLIISNTITAESWNSYTSSYPRQLQMYSTNYYVGYVSNVVGTSTNLIWPNSTYSSYSISSSNITTTNVIFPANAWAGSLSASASHFLPVKTVFTNVPPVQYYNAARVFKPVALITNTTAETGQGFYVPEWDLYLTNHLVYALIDTTVTPSRIIDYVNLNVEDTMSNIVGQLSTTAPQVGGMQMWDTNRVGGSMANTVATLGVRNQESYSLGVPSFPSQSDWIDFANGAPSALTVSNAIASFWYYRFHATKPGYPPLSSAQKQSINNQTNVAAPYTPSVVYYSRKLYAVNDPLVHYTLGDLTQYLAGTPSVTNTAVKASLASTLITSDNTLIQPAHQNPYYRPWGGNRDPGGTLNVGVFNATNYDNTIKDAGVRWPDDWDFPTNKFASIGQLGRVHRGTPWQTVYLKAGVADTNGWYQWANNNLTHPTNDWALLDLFTAAPDENATRSLLSINQSGRAAWAAVLGGVNVLSNSASVPDLTSLRVANIDPSTTEFSTIVDGINAYRQSLSNQIPAGVFTNVGQILGVAQLSTGTTPAGVATNSPYLGSQALDTVNLLNNDNLKDALQERLPEEILSLLTVERYPRVVIYSFGQALRPAPRSLILTPGVNRLLCTNYQITGETITRTVVRFEGSPTNAPGTPNALRSVVESFNVFPSY